MKVTRKQLKQIIKEELEAVLSEQTLGLGDRFRDKLFRTVFILFCNHFFMNKLNFCL